MTEIGPYKVPEGIVVWPMIYALQNSLHNWDDPEDFNPVRTVLQYRGTAWGEVGSTLPTPAGMWFHHVHVWLTPAYCARQLHRLQQTAWCCGCSLCLAD